MIRKHLFTDDVRGQFWVASTKTAAQGTRVLVGKVGNLADLQKRAPVAYATLMKAELRRVDDNEAFLLARDLPWVPEQVRGTEVVMTAAEVAERLSQACGVNFAYIDITAYLD